MNKIYNIIGAAFASLALLASCDEWEIMARLTFTSLSR